MGLDQHLIANAPRRPASATAGLETADAADRRARQHDPGRTAADRCPRPLDEAAGFQGKIDDLHALWRRGDASGARDRSWRVELQAQVRAAVQAHQRGPQPGLVAEAARDAGRAKPATTPWSWSAACTCSGADGLVSQLAATRLQAASASSAAAPGRCSRPGRAECTTRSRCTGRRAPYASAWVRRRSRRPGRPGCISCSRCIPLRGSAPPAPAFRCHCAGLTGLGCATEQMRQRAHAGIAAGRALVDVGVGLARAPAHRACSRRNPHCPHWVCGSSCSMRSASATGSTREARRIRPATHQAGSKANSRTTTTVTMAAPVSSRSPRAPHGCRQQGQWRAPQRGRRRRQRQAMQERGADRPEQHDREGRACGRRDRGSGIRQPRRTQRHAGEHRRIRHQTSGNCAQPDVAGSAARRRACASGGTAA